MKTTKKQMITPVQGRCPKCVGNNLDYDDDAKTSSDGNIIVNAVCVDCKADIEEIYTMSYSHSEIKSNTTDRKGWIND